MEIVLKGAHEIIEKLVPVLLDFDGGHKFFVFDGEMGAGKTTTIKAFCEYLGVKDMVSSPTFSLVNEYSNGKEVLYHFDFYRIKQLEEVFDLGYEEYFYSGQYCLIEWGERIESLLPEVYVKVEIEIKGCQSRKCTITKVDH